MSQRIYTPASEARQWSRFGKPADMEFALILQPDREDILAEVHNESINGIGVLLDRATTLQLCRELDIVYLGELLRAQVCHYERRADGRYLVGFQCERPERPK